MRHLTLTFVCALATASLHSQTADLVIFSDDGAKFTLLVDGDQKNAEPAARVVATGIRNETPRLLVRFEDATIPALNKPGYIEMGKEYTMMITTNKKGERVLRLSGEAELGTAAQSTPSKPKPETFVEDAPVQVTEVVGGGEEVTTTTVVEQRGAAGESVNFNMGINGVGINMTMDVNDGMDAPMTTHTTTTTTTTTRTTTSSPAVMPSTVKPVAEPEVYRMPGYTGPIGCSWPMSATEFAEAKKSIESKSFEETRMTTAKQVGRDRCFTTEQVKGLMGTFNFEDTKLEFAKFAYDRTYDIGNYYRVNDAFTFESSVDDLNSYIQAR